MKIPLAPLGNLVCSGRGISEARRWKTAGGLAVVSLPQAWATSPPAVQVDFLQKSKHPQVRSALHLHS